MTQTRTEITAGPVWLPPGRASYSRDTHQQNGWTLVIERWQITGRLGWQRITETWPAPEPATVQAVPGETYRYPFIGQPAPWTTPRHPWTTL
jgi:hypothetical protein